VKQGLSEKEQAVLNQAFARIVAAGKQLGIAPGNMVELLDSGMTVTQLFDYLMAKLSGTQIES
jgi:hypothetical protein